MAGVKKAIIPIAGSATRFLPLSKILPKEFWPLVDKPAIQYIIEEIIGSGIKEAVFVSKPGEKTLFDYFKKKIKSKKIFKSRYKNQYIEELKKIDEISRKISFSKVIQRRPLGDGHAILQAEKAIKKQSCAVLFCDDIIDAKTPCLKQLIKVFNKYRQPIITLCKVPKQNFGFYGMVDAELIGNRVYRIKKIVEKPLAGQSPSNLAIVGKYIITPEVFEFLKKNALKQKGEIGLSGALSEMIKKGKKIYGCEVEGKWLECGNKLAYLKSNIYLSLKHPKFGKELKNYLKKEIL